ncbi:MAG TPA: hypothetical protein PKN32_14805 [Bacteroidales bacterium]|jgi:hypothetical protein|nr:hypothetical protein [Bacteroidales bacterium]
MRCEKVLRKDFHKRFGDATKEVADVFLSKTGRFIDDCPQCKLKTIQVVVTPIIESKLHLS